MGEYCESKYFTVGPGTLQKARKEERDRERTKRNVRRRKEKRKVRMK
jgi:hypothetical protein